MDDTVPDAVPEGGERDEPWEARRLDCGSAEAVGVERCRGCGARGDNHHVLVPRCGQLCVS